MAECSDKQVADAIALLERGMRQVPEFGLHLDRRGLYLGTHEGSFVVQRRCYAELAFEALTPAGWVPWPDALEVPPGAQWSSLLALLLRLVEDQAGERARGGAAAAAGG